MTTATRSAFRIDATTRAKVARRWVYTTTTLADGIASAPEAARVRARLAALHPAALVASVGYNSAA
jgi:hypothetical protein